MRERRKTIVFLVLALLVLSSISNVYANKTIDCEHALEDCLEDVVAATLSCGLFSRIIAAGVGVAGGLHCSAGYAFCQRYS
ncbi:hypothetical protein KAR48_14720 [bacterium]|nr:hypothetical protein [bacterium]